jgi:hypothetical protein
MSPLTWSGGQIGQAGNKRAGFTNPSAKGMRSACPGSGHPLGHLHVFMNKRVPTLGKVLRVQGQPFVTRGVSTTWPHAWWLTTPLLPVWRTESKSQQDRAPLDQTVVPCLLGFQRTPACFGSWPPPPSPTSCSHCHSCC